MKILQYVPFIDRKLGGVSAYIHLLSRDLGKLCELHVITHHSSNEFELENCNVHFIPFLNFPSKSIKKQFLQILGSLNPDVFHTNGCWQPLDAYFAIWAKQRGYKVVYTPHGMLEPYAIKRHYWTKKLPAILLFQKKGIQSSDLIHATAESEKQNILKLGWNKNVCVIPNCVQIEDIQNKWELEKFNGHNYHRSKNILFLSRVHPKKGLNFLLEALAVLKDRLSGYSVTIAGPGEESYIKELKTMASKLGVEKMIEFVGPVFGDSRWSLYQKADLFILPTYSENFGIVILEALASGTPVITTVGTPWIQLDSYNCGWCTEIGTQPTINAIERFLDCSDIQLKKMGTNGRKLVIDHYTSMQVASQINNMYYALLH